jgi:lysophospholipase L1-like esterase
MRSLRSAPVHRARTTASLVLLLLCGLLVPLRAGEAPDQPQVKLDKAGAPDARFLARHEQFLAGARTGGHDLVLLGDFLTDDFRGHAKNQVGAIFTAAFAQYRPLNLGQGGDHTQHVLWRVQNGELAGYAPRVMMLMIGGTNGSNGDPPDRILAGVSAIIASARQQVPGLKVLLLPVLPWDAKPGARRTRHQAVNALLPQLDDGGKTVLYVDISGRFLAADQQIPEDLMPDGAHLSELGYQVWADAVVGPLARLMGQGAP